MKLLKSGFSLLLVLCLGLFVQCKSDKKDSSEAETAEAKTERPAMTKEDFGTTPEGEKVEQYTLKNEKGMEVKIITYGGRITNLTAPDKNGEYEDVVLGFDSIEDYVKDNPFFGALIGRYGNRIANGKFTLDGKEYDLAKNDGSNHLHGGVRGFDKVIWTAEETPDSTNSLKLTYTSKDMEEGYPGNLDVTVTYTLNDDNSLDVDYEATTDKKTVVNLTQHSYFNLTGDFSNKILNTVVEIDADKFIPINETLIPTGEIKDVEGTPFDFRQPKAIGKEIESDNQQLKRAGGYDHCWVLNDQDSGVRFASSAYDPESGRFMQVYTDEPGLQFYTGNFLDNTLPAKGGGTYAKRSGFCMETEHYPDSPNQKGFPSVVLNPGEKYSSHATFKFSVN
ncbi:MAG: aldose epimerase family protein [Salegentibacter sp.]